MIRKSSNRRQRSGIWLHCRTLRTLKQIHGLLAVKGLQSNPPALRELLFTSAVSIPAAMEHAHQLFDQIPQPDLFMWNTIIRGAAHSPTPLRAISLLARMQRSSIRPNNFTFPFLLRASTKLSSPVAGAQFHATIVKLGFESDEFVRNALINHHANCGDLKVATTLFDRSARSDPVAWSALISGYAKRGELGIARKLFHESPAKDLISWNVMITGYAKRGEMESARELFDQVPTRDVVSWNAMIAGYVQLGSHRRAMEVFEEMNHAGERPDEVTMLSLLSACSNSVDLDIGRRLHQPISELCSRTGVTLLLANTLIDMYAKCGSIEGSLEVFRGMREKDISTWNSVIGGLAFHGHCDESIILFEEMRSAKVCPNEITFVNVLVACSHGGMVEEGRGYFSLMRDEYGIEPNVKHYGCIVDMLGRAGMLRGAFEFVETMDIEPNQIVWRALFGACRLHGDIELGEQANEELLKMRRDESGDYVLLSNIYASEGEWNGVEKVRRLMDDRGVMKEAGSALVGADNKEPMHFLLGNPQSDFILKGSVQ